MKDNKNVKSFGQFNENLNIFDVISSTHKIKVDEKTGEIKLPKHKLEIPTDYYL